MGLQDDWARLTVRELVQQFHEPRQRRLRLYLANLCRTESELFESSCGPFALQEQLLSIAERYADGLATESERR